MNSTIHESYLYVLPLAKFEFIVFISYNKIQYAFVFVTRYSSPFVDPIIAELKFPIKISF